MQLAEIEARLTAMGFQEVDETAGFKGDKKWRHSSRLNTQGRGSIWIQENEIRATGVRANGYATRMQQWEQASRTDATLAQAVPVWTDAPSDARIEALLDAMALHVTPQTQWP